MQTHLVIYNISGTIMLIILYQQAEHSMHTDQKLVQVHR